MEGSKRGIMVGDWWIDSGYCICYDGVGAFWDAERRLPYIQLWFYVQDWNGQHIFSC